MLNSRTDLTRRLRVKAGRTKFQAQQLLATNAVPLYRRVRSIDSPLADRYLFVLAHPRSGSTVLSHVLQSHDEVLGFGEHHEGYTSATDLEALAARNAFFDRAPTTKRKYTLDKIVWNENEFDDAILARPDTRFVFLAREPVATLESYQRMFHYIATDEQRLHLYRSRLEGMIDVAERIGDTERMAFVTYDELTGATDAVLSRLTNWLDLDSPLTPQYDLNNKSGSQSWGDPSQHIKAGAIIAVPPPSGDVDLDVVDQANTVYRTSCERLAALTTPVRQSAVAPEAR